MDDLPLFGHTLRDRRKARDLTQEALAEQVHCSIETIRKIEAGKLRPSRPLAALLTDALAIPMEERAAFLHAARATVEPLQPVLPQGPVTFLFTDIEGSTQLWEQHPQAMQHVLARHDTILHETITAHTGVIIKSTGDGVLAAFARPPDALIAALAAQRSLQTENWGGPGPLRVRMAIHIGVANERAGDYFGPPVNRAARLLAAGHGGQILLSLATVELVRDHLPPNVALHDLGTHRLKDLTRPEHIFQVVAPDLPADFPLLQTLDARRTNLPIQPTPLIGREQEVARVCALVRRPDVRLVTLSGPGGIGKTRLGLQVAAELLDDFADGIYFIDLAPVRDPVLVGPAIAHTLGVTEKSSRPLLEDLKIFLRDKQMLLVLDNFEQVLDAAPLVSQLLAAAPGLKALSTSRIVLKVRGEKEFPVPPLALPDPLRLPPLDVLSQYAAVELFIQRAVDVKSNFQVTHANALAVAEICARLDGLPLAIELAAARIKLFTPEQLLTRLERRLSMLISGPRDVPARQQTLRNTIDWSYQLLDADEQRLFARLGVFVGGCTLEAAEAICTLEGEMESDMLDGLAALVDQSLVRQNEGLDGEPRLMMLETIREYAVERLVACGELEATLRRHATYYLTLAEAAGSGLWGLQHKHWIDRLDQEHANLRAVLDWASARGETELGLQLGSVLWNLWEAQGTETEGRARLSALLAQAQGDQPTLARINVLYGAGLMAFDQDDVAAGQALWEERLRLARELGDPSAIGDALRDVGWRTYKQGDATTARHLIEESLAIHRNLGNQQGVVWALSSLARLSAEQGEYARARSLGEQSLAMVQELGDISAITPDLLTILGEIARLEGDYPLARSHFEPSLALGRAWNDTWLIAQSCSNLGYVTLNEGDADRAMALFQESLVLGRQAERGRTMLLGIVGIAGVASVRQQPERAVRLLGAATAFLDDTHITLDPTDRRDYDRIVANVQVQLDEASFTTVWAAGHAMPITEAIAYALAPMSEVTPQPDRQAPT